MKALRVIVAIVLALFMVGFGICAGCGALMIAGQQIRSGDIGMVVVLSLLGAGLAAACFFGMRALLRANKKDE